MNMENKSFKIHDFEIEIKNDFMTIKEGNKEIAIGWNGQRFQLLKEALEYIRIEK
jgi:hypothetical protein